MAPSPSSPDDAPAGLPLDALTWPQEPGVRALRTVLARHARGTVRALGGLARHPWPPPFARDVAAVLARAGSLPRGKLAGLVRHVWISGPLRAAQGDAGRGAWGPAREALTEALLPLAASLPGPPIEVPLPSRPPALQRPEGGPPPCPAPALGPGAEPRTYKAVLWTGRGAIATLPAQARRVRLRWPRGPAAPPALTPLDAAGRPLARTSAEPTWTPAVLDASPAGRLALADNNPLRADEAHPDKGGNLLSLGGASPGTWIEALRLGYALIATAAPALADELRLGLQHWVPVGVDAERHLSASFQEVVGLAYLSLHAGPDGDSQRERPRSEQPGPRARVSLRPGAALVMFEAMVHEFQHNKLNAALASGPLLHNAFAPLYASPVRPDPRPLHGVLLAAHAFVPVERVYDRLRALGHPATRGPEAARRLERVRAANDEAMETLATHARWTPAGELLWRGLSRAHALR